MFRGGLCERGVIWGEVGVPKGECCGVEVGVLRECTLKGLGLVDWCW